MTSVDAVEADGLRQRNVPLHAKSSEEARETVLRLNKLENHTGKTEHDKKTFGRTPDGTVFVVPETHDMVSQLLSPSEPKNVSDLLVLAVLVSMISLLWALPKAAQPPVYGCLFIFWRLSYNIGIGWLLQKQSKQQTLVRWARKTKLFGKPTETRHPRLRSFVKGELEKKIARDYDFDTAPLEYNTWLVFRRIVDLILMCDFTSYVLFAISCGGRPVDEMILLTIARWIVGLVLIAFNLWVKLDAHRVVKDYAWYWGDFFYLVDVEGLIFDGVFEMAPHPMYSIGYIGFYGISLISASYKVMFISIFAHALQFAFLVVVESPHIEKTYNAPPPRQQYNEAPLNASDRPRTPRTDTASAWPNAGLNKPPETHSTLQLDLYRAADTSTILVQLMILLLTLVTPKTRFCQGLFVTIAVICRLWFSAGIGYLLNRQSTKKKWTRHFLKHGESTGEAWRQWKSTYLLSMTMCYATFCAAAWKSYVPPSGWTDGLVLLRHTIGVCLVALQIWVAVSVYDQLTEFGFFYGDFFFDHSPKLNYGGIYRFLNNPERVLGLSGVWGIALITQSRSMFLLALLSHTLSLLFIQTVERPHMIKLYGKHLRQDSGLVRSLKRSLPPPLRQWQDGIDKMLAEALDTVEEFLDNVRPQIGNGLGNVVEPTKEWLAKYPANVQNVNAEPDSTEGVAEGYTLRIEGDEAFNPTSTHESVLQLEYGSPIRVHWTAPFDHSTRDWVGLYSLASRNASKENTTVSSQGRWIATNFGVFDDLSSELGLIASDIETEESDKAENGKRRVTGKMVFSGDKLFWERGLYEFRYHQAGKHNVMAISSPFEIRIPRFSEADLELVEPSGKLVNAHNEDIIRRAIEKALLPVVRNCFDRDPSIAPSTDEAVFAQETFGALIEREGKYARRLVYAIQQMFGIEFAPQVVKADGQISNLAWRILEAEKVLQPYSMSKSRGTSTPTEQ